MRLILDWPEEEHEAGTSKASTANKLILAQYKHFSFLTVTQYACGDEQGGTLDLRKSIIEHLRIEKILFQDLMVVYNILLV